VTKLEAIRRRIPELPDAELSLHEKDRRWLLGLVDAFAEVADVSGYSSDRGCWCSAFDRGVDVHDFACVQMRAVFVRLNEPEDGTQGGDS
jgi:hypothetical protein